MEESGRPSMVNLGKPDAVSASTRTRCASTPSTAAVNDVASIAHTSAAQGRHRIRSGRVDAPEGEARRRTESSAVQGRRGSATAGSGGQGYGRVQTVSRLPAASTGPLRLFQDISSWTGRRE